MLTYDPELFRIRPGEWVLDAGCGDGRHTRDIAYRYGRAVATDLGAANLARARNLYRSNLAYLGGGERGSVAFLQGSLLRLPFRDGAFDRVLASEVLEHIPDDQQAVRELVRVLKPGGPIVVSVPTYLSEKLCSEVTYAVYGRQSRRFFNAPGGHIRMYRTGELVQLLRGAGLRIVALRFEHGLHTIYWFLRCVDDQAAVVRWYLRAFFEWGWNSPFMGRVEDVANYVVPKSLVVYARKPRLS